jgi:hypothetical protein
MTEVTDDEKRDLQMQKLTWLGNLMPHPDSGNYGVMAYTAQNTWLSALKTKSDEAKTLAAASAHATSLSI